MRSVVRFEPSDLLPSRPAVLLRAGVPADREASARVLDIAARATEIFLRESEPAGLLEEVSLDELLGLHRDGRAPGEPSVLETVAPLAARLALFAATLGEPLCARIRGLFDAGDAPLGFLLDSVASEAATALAEELAGSYLADGAAAGLAVLAYSPGYCGWPVTGQRALFARLRPGEIGISLGESALMSPVKSVSGVLVAATPRAHRFRPDFEFCDRCTDRSCIPRMASLSAPAEAPAEGEEP